MGMNIGNDLNRFKEIVKGKIRRDLKKYASAENLVGSQGGKIVKIPLSNIDIPRFTFSSGNGGTGSGSGEVGDEVGGGQGKSKKPSPGKPGEETGDHQFFEFDKSELAQIIKEELELPNLEQRGSGKVHSEKTKYNKINRVGNEALRHFKRTYKEAIKRQISNGSYDPENPVIIPEKSDKRYKTYSVEERPDVNAVCFFIGDVSGSMEEQQKRLMKSLFFWIDLILEEEYKEIENIFIIHDYDAKEVSKDDFFKISTGGGTNISSAYKLINKKIEEEYPYSEYNIYIFQMSDGDDAGKEEETRSLLTEKLLPNCNMFCYGQTESRYGSGAHMNLLLPLSSKYDNIALASISKDDDIFPAIKTFFKQGK